MTALRANFLFAPLVNKLLIITRRNFSNKTNMGLSYLPPELWGLILANIFSDKWNRCEILSLRTICRKYSKRVF